MMNKNEIAQIMRVVNEANVESPGFMKLNIAGVDKELLSKWINSIYGLYKGAKVIMITIDNVEAGRVIEPLDSSLHMTLDVDGTSKVYFVFEAHEDREIFKGKEI